MLCITLSCNEENNRTCSQKRTLCVTGIKKITKLINITRYNIYKVYNIQHKESLRDFQ